MFELILVCLFIIVGLTLYWERKRLHKIPLLIKAGMNKIVSYVKKLFSFIEKKAHDLESKFVPNHPPSEKKKYLNNHVRDGSRIKKIRAEVEKMEKERAEVNKKIQRFQNEEINKLKQQIVEQQANYELLLKRNKELDEINIQLMTGRKKGEDPYKDVPTPTSADEIIKRANDIFGDVPLEEG